MKKRASYILAAGKGCRDGGFRRNDPGRPVLHKTIAGIDLFPTAHIPKIFAHEIET
jgi:hypothetical protein